MNIAIVGSRTFNNYKLLKKLILENIELSDINNIISGGCYGTDKLAEQFAKEFDINIDIYPAQWDKYGKSAGPKRNKLIVENCDILIAFIKDESKGTKNSISIAENLGKQIIVFEL